MQSLVVIERPTDPVPSLKEVKAHLRVDFKTDDVDITSKIWGAITEFEDPELGWLGRSILPRLLELRLDAFCSEIAICGPLLPGEALTVKYDDQDGVEQTLPTSVYRILDPERSSCRLVLKKGQAWPQVSGEAQCVRVRFTAGYELDDRRIDNFKSAVKLHVEMTYDGADDQERARISETINRLLQPFRVYR